MDHKCLVREGTDYLTDLHVAADIAASLQRIAHGLLQELPSNEGNWASRVLLHCVRCRLAVRKQVR